MGQRTTSSTWASGIVQALELEGLDSRALFATLGLDHAALADPDARFAQDDMTRLWQLAANLSGNPAIGLNLARVVRPASFHVLGYVLMSSATLAEGFTRLVRYLRIIAESAELICSRCDEGYSLQLRVRGDHLPPTRHSTEASLATALSLCAWLTGREVVPVRVQLQGPRPADPAPWREVFRAPVQFEAPVDALILTAADMEWPLPKANAAMATIHEQFAGQYLARFTEGHVSHRVRQVICRDLHLGEPKRERVAELLHLSPRTLQRRLQDEGTSFQVLLDEARRELAEQYLSQPQVTLLETAYLLGFADPSTFFRAFRRWFGSTPGEFRSRLGGQAPLSDARTLACTVPAP